MENKPLSILFGFIVMCLALQISTFAQQRQSDNEKWPHVYNTKDFKFGIIDDMGNEILAPKYDFIHEFGRGHRSKDVLSYAQLDYTIYKEHKGLINKTGVLDKEGNVVFQPIACQHISNYFQMDSLSNDKYARFIKDKKNGLINDKGKIIFPPKKGRFHGPNLINGSAPVLIDCCYGYINRTGKLIIPNQFHIAHPFAFGKAWVNKDGKWGLINEKGDLIIDYKYEEVKEFSEEGLAAVKLDGKWGFINESGQIIVEFKFEIEDPHWYFDQILNNRHVYRIRQDSTIGYIDRSGNVVLETKFQAIRRFDSSGLAGFFVHEKWGFIDTVGVIKIPPIYEEVFPFYESELATVFDGENYWLINREGVKTAGPFNFFILPFRESNIAVFQESLFSRQEQGLVDLEGNIILDLIPAKIVGFRNLNYSRVLFGDRVGLVNKKGVFFGFDMQELLEGGEK